ncbi:MAG: response regulator [Gemmatimonadetes bacterium]|jgi:CheY-like chemotaxis protein|nr:response regulator [Gemmatimonadota bacterium]
MKRILIVEDDEMVRNVLRKMLEKLPLKVQEAGDGERGLALLVEERFDLVIADYRMPRMDGLTMLKQCRELFPEHPCIVVSGERPEGINQLEKVFFFQKPIDSGALLNLVKHLLRLD